MKTQDLRRRLRSIAALGLAPAALAALATAAASARPARLPFPAAEYAPYDSAGTGEISGTGVASPAPGVRASLAGRRVVLRPVTSWSRLWWNRWVLGHGMLHQQDPLAASHARFVEADSAGAFHFTGLPAGEYYVQGTILWQSGGGEPPTTVFVILGTRVALAAGAHARVALDSLGTDLRYGSVIEMSRPSAPDSLAQWWGTFP